LNEIGEKDRFDVIVTNPPFGGEEEAGIQLNFPENTRASETALLFMQFIMRSLKRGGRSGVVAPNGFLFGDGVAARITAQLLRDFNLHTIIRLPNGVFAPYTSIPTNLLFFDRTPAMAGFDTAAEVELAKPVSRPAAYSTSGSNLATVDIWFYEHVLPEGVKNYTKTRPMQFEEFQPILDWWDNRDDPSTAAQGRAWKVRAADVIVTNGGGDVVSVNLDIKNPSRKEDLEHLPPAELAESILAKEKQIAAIMDEIKSLLAKGG
jgi:type I restriction enzyme M protein